MQTKQKIGPSPSVLALARRGGQRISLLGAASLLAALLGACSDPVDLPNRAPSATVERPVLSPSGLAVDVYYDLDDADGDDLSVSIEACVGSECTEGLTQAPGGDGVVNLTSLPDDTVTHLFRWDAGCDAVAAGETTRIRITPRDADSEGVTVYSPPFTLESLGFDAACGAEAERLGEGS